MRDDLNVHDSSGSEASECPQLHIFEDMGVPDAEERLARAELARVVRKTIRERGLTQAQAAEVLGVKQPDVSDLVRGKLSRFSRERLERFLNALDLGSSSGSGHAPPGRSTLGSPSRS